MHQFAPGDSPGEPVFVPRDANAPEGDGFLVATLYRAAENRTDFVVFDAQDVRQGPDRLGRAAPPRALRLPWQLGKRDRMIHFLRAFKPLAVDFLSTIVFIVLYAITGSVVLGIVAGIALGIGQIGWLLWRRHPIASDAMGELALVIVLGSAALHHRRSALCHGQASSASSPSAASC